MKRNRSVRNGSWSARSKLRRVPYFQHCDWPRNVACLTPGDPARLSCRIESYSCNFPFRHNGLKKTSCISSSDIDASDDDGNDYFCKPSMGTRAPRGLGWSWGVCGDSCFEAGSDCKWEFNFFFILISQYNDSTSDPLDFTGDSADASSEDCKSSETECVFPFRYNGTWHEKCTDIGSGDGSMWCATRVDRKTKEMVDNFWGVCKMASCHLSEYVYCTMVVETPGTNCLNYLL